MSEWIKRSEQEPPRDGSWVLAEKSYGRFVAIRWDAESSVWRDHTCDIIADWPRWARFNPPPRTVTIEISEEDARSFSRCFVERGPSLTFGETARLGEACRKALEAKR